MTGDPDTAGRRLVALGAAETSPAPAHVDIPPLWCPIPAAAPARWQEVELRSVQWMTRYGLFGEPALRRRVLATRAAEWAARVAPNAGREGLQVFADSVYRDLVFDDETLDAGPVGPDPGGLLPYLQILLYVMNHPEARPGRDAFVQTLHDVARRWRSLASPTALRRWIDGHTTWLYAAAAVVAHRAGGTLPDLNEYAIIGPADRGNVMSISGIEMAEGTALPTAEMETPPVRAVTAAAGVLVTLDSDLFCYPREIVRGTPESNVVAVLRHARRLPAPAAVAEAVRLRDRIMCLYLALRDQLRHGAGTDLRVYLDQLDHYIRGNLDWSLTAPRYQTRIDRAHSVAGRESRFADHPTDGSLAAPPIPAIAWWWGQLDRSRP